MQLPDLGPYYAGLRYALTAGGAVAVTLGFAAGSIDAQSILSGLNDISDGVKLIMQGGGTIIAVVAPIYGILQARMSAKVTAVSTMPEVKGIITHDTPAGVAVANAAPDNVVPAGSAQAATVAKAA